MTPAATAFVVAAAFAAGIVDAIAGGGGPLTLPALLAVGLPPQLAIPTNKGQSTFGTTASFASYWARGGIDRDRAIFAFGAGFVGSCCGALALLSMRPEPLRPVVIVLLTLAAAIVLLRGRIHALARPRKLAHPAVLVVAIGLAMGAYDGFFGPGVGSLLIVVFTLVFGDTLTRASGNAKVVNLASNLAALCIFASQGLVLWRISLPMAAANALGAVIGARFALSKGDRLVRAVVLVVVCAVILKLVVDMTRG